MQLHPFYVQSIHFHAVLAFFHSENFSLRVLMELWIPTLSGDPKLDLGSNMCAETKKYGKILA